MGQKVHPVGFRLGYNRPHDALWFADRQYSDFCGEDMRIRDYLDRFSKKRPVSVARNFEERKVEEGLKNASISRVVIGRSVNTILLTIHSAKPGVIIGRAGQGIDVLRTLLQRLTRRQVTIDVVEERDPDLNAQLVAEKIASQLSRRISFRRAVRQAIQATGRCGAEGVKVSVAGRLAGGEMARRHVQKEGKVPLQTLRADIDYGVCEANTAYGNIGVKVWIYRGERVPEDGVGTEAAPALAVEPVMVAAPAAPRAESGERRPRGRRQARRRPEAPAPEAPDLAGAPPIQEAPAPSDGGQDEPRSS